MEQKGAFKNKSIDRREKEKEHKTWRNILPIHARYNFLVASRVKLKKKKKQHPFPPDNILDQNIQYRRISPRISNIYLSIGKDNNFNDREKAFYHPLPLRSSTRTKLLFEILRKTGGEVRVSKVTFPGGDKHYYQFRKSAYTSGVASSRRRRRVSNQSGHHRAQVWPRRSITHRRHPWISVVSARTAWRRRRRLRRRRRWRRRRRARRQRQRRRRRPARSSILNVRREPPLGLSFVYRVLA